MYMDYYDTIILSKQQELNLLQSSNSTDMSTWVKIQELIYEINELLIQKQYHTEVIGCCCCNNGCCQK